VQWLVVSLVLSVVLTLLLNVWLRAFPEASDRLARRLDELTSQDADDPDGPDHRVRVVIPWKAMIVGSIILTIVINLVLWIGG
jgi:hypothetical protein